MRVTLQQPLLAIPSTEDLWRSRVAAWHHSGLDPDAFCADQPFAPSTLLGWSRRLRRQAAATFIEVRPRVVDPPRPELVVEVGATRIRVAKGFDPALLNAVVAALGGGAR